MANQLEIFMTGQQFKQLCEKHYDCIMTEYDINKVEIDILFFLYSTNFHTAKDIVRIRHISKSHVSSAIDDLKEKGYIHCKPDPKDHRRICLSLSDNATSLIEQINALHEKLGNVLYQGITEEEKQVMKSVVGKMLQNISSAIQEFESARDL